MVQKPFELVDDKIFKKQNQNGPPKKLQGVTLTKSFFYTGHFALKSCFRHLWPL